MHLFLHENNGLWRCLPPKKVKNKKYHCLPKENMTNANRVTKNKCKVYLNNIFLHNTYIQSQSSA